MNTVVKDLQGVLEGWLQSNNIKEVEWAKIRRLDFQELLRHRDTLVGTLDTFTCTACPHFEEHVSTL